MKNFSLFTIFFFILNHTVLAGYSTFEKAEEVAADLYEQNPDSFLAIWHVPKIKSLVAMPIPHSSGYSYNTNVHPLNSHECHSNDHRIWCFRKTGYYVAEISPHSGSKEKLDHLTFQEFGSSIKNNLVAVYSLGNLQTKSFKKAFADCPNLRYVLHGDTSQATDMSEMFANATGLESIGTSQSFSGLLFSYPKWDTSKVKDMSNMFKNTHKTVSKKQILYLSKWNVSQVEKMSGMFFKSGFPNVLIQLWDVSSVKQTDMMFRETTMRPDVRKWDVSNLENMSYMFGGTASREYFYPNVRRWKAYKLKNMEGAFNGIEFPQELNTLFDDPKVTANVSNMRFAFSHTTNPPVALNLSNIVNMHRMYRNAKMNIKPTKVSEKNSTLKDPYLQMEHYWSLLGFENRAAHNIEDLTEIFREVSFEGVTDYTKAWINRQRLTETLLSALRKGFLTKRNSSEIRNLMNRASNSIKARGIAYCGEQDWNHIQSGPHGEGFYLRPKLTHNQYKYYVSTCQRFRDALSGFYTGFNFCNTGGPRAGGKDQYSHLPVACHYKVDQNILQKYPRKKEEVALVNIP